MPCSFGPGWAWNLQRILQQPKFQVQITMDPKTMAHPREPTTKAKNHSGVASVAVLRVVLFVRICEEPALRKMFGADYECRT
jgi:hypothetical protein